MAIHFHEEDLPFRRPIGGRCSDCGRYGGHGPGSGPRPAVPGPAVGRLGRRASGPLRSRQRLFGAEPEGACWPIPTGSSSITSRASTWRSCAPISGSWRRRSIARGRVAAGPHLHRPPRPEGPGQGADRNRPVQAAADQRLGRPEISDAQREYAASDVRYLHRLKEQLDVRLARENRSNWPRPASISSRRGRCSTSPAGPRWTSSPMTGSHVRSR